MCVFVIVTDNINCKKKKITRFLDKKDLITMMGHILFFFNSGIDFQGVTVGLANVFTMCTESSAGINQVIMKSKPIVKDSIL